MLGFDSHFLRAPCQRSEQDSFSELDIDVPIFGRVSSSFVTTMERYPPIVGTTHRRVRLRTNLGKLIGDLTPEELRRQLATRGLRLKPARLQEFIDGTFVSIRRREAEVLMNWCHDQGGHFFDRVESTAWRTFTANVKTVLFSGCDDRGAPLKNDLKVQEYVHTFLEERSCRVLPPQTGIDDITTVRRAMRAHNCVFIGSPKSNPASEIALALMFQALPFNSSSENRSKMRLRFRSAHWPSRVGDYASIDLVEPGSSEGLVLRPEEWGEEFSRQARAQRDAGSGRVQGSPPSEEILRVPWRPFDEFCRAAGRSFEAGAIVVAHRPLGATRDVTTMVLAGYSAYSTRQIAHDLARDLVGFADVSTQVGRPELRIAYTPYKKESGTEEYDPAPTPQWFSVRDAVRMWPNLLRTRDRLRKRPVNPIPRR